MTARNNLSPADMKEALIRGDIETLKQLSKADCLTLKKVDTKVNENV